jgi:hypothetical protein
MNASEPSEEASKSPLFAESEWSDTFMIDCIGYLKSWIQGKRCKGGMTFIKALIRNRRSLYMM